jgi:uncharacterized membrane protein YdjX (TVP38/TMEM64 family)
MTRWWLLVLVLLAVCIVPFVVYGEAFADGGLQAWVNQYGAWAWLAGVAVLCADIVLPIPGTLVMTVLGYLYGWWLGGLISAGGSILAGLLAYAGSRALGRPAARWMAGDEALAQGERWFATEQAGWLLALSRWTPILPEAVACLAGLARMPLARFTLALACGSVPLGFAFAAIGHLGASHSGLALLLSAIVPLLLYAGSAWMLRNRPNHG